MDATGFLSLREKHFFPKSDVIMTTGGRELSQNVQCCLTDPMLPSVTLYLNPCRRYGHLNVCRPLQWLARAL